MSTTEYYSETLGLPQTDPARWRLRVSNLGAERWEYIDESQIENDPQSFFVKYLLQTKDFDPKVQPKATNAYQSAKNGAMFFKELQSPEGIFPNQYKGPMFMTIGYVVACYYSKTPIPEPQKIELIRYIVNTAHPVDGGWGLHSIDKSTCFGTAINYVILRLLGLPADHEVCVRARKTLLKLGGAVGVPHWGKAWFSVLNIYKWEGCNPAPPELWSLPYALSIHPGKWWVHTRAIYLALGYLSAGKFQADLDPLLIEIRGEIYKKPFDEIDFSKHRNTVCGVDLYYPHTTLLNVANNAMVFYEKYVRPDWVLKKSLKYTYELIIKEQENTEYLSIAPVNAAFNAVVHFIEEGKNSAAFKRAMDRFQECIFHGPQGSTVMGTNGSQVWDTAFSIQYIYMAGLSEEPELYDYIANGYKFLVRSQFDTECAEGSFRDKRVGGWPFSTKEQGYTVSDCTAEAIKAIVMVQNDPNFANIKDLIKDKNLNDGIDRLLAIQNLGSFSFGSFSAYEKIKATPLIEYLNPAEVFANIMVEYPYVECSDSVVLGLTYFRQYHTYRRADVDLSIKRAVQFIKNAQEEDGSWYGSWGVCYSYAGMFALEALSTIGETYENSDVVRKGCDFLVKRQRKDGGWSESMKASECHTYIETEQSLVIQTAWVLIGLILVDYPDVTIIEKGINLIMSRQLPTGEWLYEDMEGVFNHSCAIEYPNYRFLFPIKALGLYHKKYNAKK